MYILNLKKFNLSGKERRKLGEYLSGAPFNGKYIPEVSAVTFKRELLKREQQRILGFVNGMNLANLWADEDGDIEIEDDGGDDEKS